MRKGYSIEYIKPEDVDENLYYEANTWDNFNVATHFTIIPAEKEEDFDEVVYYVKRNKVFGKLNGGEGYIYILECLNQPGICKIGMTERTPNERLKEINGATGVIVPWLLAAAYPCKTPRAIEKLVHLELQKVRVTSNKEGFDISVKAARGIIEKVINANDAKI